MRKENAGETAFDSFLRDYIALRTRATKQVKSDGIYTAFRQLWSTLRTRGDSVEAIVTDLKQYAAYHAAFSLGRVQAGPVHDALASLRRLVDVSAILVMQLFACRDQNSSVTDAELVEALRLPEKSPGVSLNKLFEICSSDRDVTLSDDVRTANESVRGTINRLQSLGYVKNIDKSVWKMR